MKGFFLFIFLCAVQHSFPQKQNNIWYFGEYAGVTFNSGIPVALSNNPMFTNEGTSVICDDAGNLLFFTDGISVWNRNLQVMPNGTGLMGNISTTQSALIVPEPGNCNIYYIFTAPAQDTTIPLYYNILNLSLDGGLGDISSKNIPLYGSVTERLTGTLQSNGVDYWVVSQAYGNNEFLAYSVTSSGVNTNPVISYSGPPINSANGGVFDVLGYMKISSDGSKLCYANLYGNTYSQLFDFDNVTGIVSNNIPLVDSMGYGVEFSPDNTKLYISTLDNPYVIRQYNLSAGSPIAIQNSVTEIVYEKFNADSTIAEDGGALELGPDNKIYSDRVEQDVLAVINEPNLSGMLCNFADTGVILKERCEDGLPNNIKTLSSNCLLPVDLLNFTSTILNKSVKLQWQTMTEINSNYFSIERSADGINFSGIGKQSAAGNSNDLTQYVFIDHTPLSTNYYRLKEVDLDGNYQYSNILLVKMQQLQPLIIMGNPVQNDLQLSINNGQSSINYLSIFDFTGRRLQSFNVQNGVQHTDVSSFAPGNYILQMITADGQVYDKIFVKQ